MSFWYMRDNHTFRPLTDDVEEGCKRVEEEYNAGYTCGAAFYKSDSIKVKDVPVTGRHLKPVLNEVRRMYADVAMATMGMGLQRSL